jgi:hypothetical protein
MDARTARPDGEAVPAEFGNVGDDFAFTVVGADALGFAHDCALPYSALC